MNKSLYLIFIFLLISPTVFGATTCSKFWGEDCSSRTLNDAFPPCNGIEKGGDEHVAEIYISKDIVKPKEYQQVICTFVPTKYWSVDKVYIYYFNGENWTELFNGIGEYKYPYNKSIYFNVGEKEGEKIVRCIISRDPITSECAREGNYYDNDDLKFIVSRPINCNISCSDKDFFDRKDTYYCKIYCNKKVNIFYTHNYTEKNYSISNYDSKHEIYIPFDSFPIAGEYILEVFAKDQFSKKKLIEKEIKLRSEAIITRIFAPEIMSKNRFKLFCNLSDKYTNAQINNFPVSFFLDGNFTGTNFTKNGVAEFTYIVKSEGLHNFSCKISNHGLYKADGVKSLETFISLAKVNITALELRNMQKKLNKLAQEVAELKFYLNISDEFKHNIEEAETMLKELNVYLNEGDVTNFKITEHSLEKKISHINLMLRVYNFKLFLANNGLLISLIIIFILCSIVFYKWCKKKKRMKRELLYYKKKEQELIKQMEQIEKEYFLRKISEEYFNRLMLENKNKLAKIRAKIEELSS